MSETSVESATQDRVLRLVVEHGPVSAAELARLLTLTPAGVRRHIAALERDERIVVHEPSGPGQRRRGRPARYYVATDAGRSGLSHAYSDLATHALQFIGDVAGPDAVDHFANQRVSGLEERYAPVVEAAGEDVADRARALAGALTQDGYAATVRSVGPRGLAVQLCQGNCPVLAVAESYHQLCDAETRAFSRLLGVHVQRLATLAGGEHVCTTHIPTTVPTGRPSTTPSPHGDETEGI
ncbi:Predicted transcriptional regulator, ArsR family [Georgenia satyanarayanai]|uniref:Predicted transcriptional regulator, ArsR family n=1 Tax=Georgenia satyanarayanai TaxID=860221 RepID=A0A2Y9AV79_9MICO|nr:helix-turn-helix domain-containing protein [Georgenia satyanarayanai]PYF97348.1 putative ArsR family transcriptional regulator [Georgenia satyanarayanai]SSA46129.1 Predicted transcriptional regulator, ArsR family [Georgenia satyanarayanai]